MRIGDLSSSGTAMKTGGAVDVGIVGGSTGTAATASLATGDVVEGRVLASENGVMLMRLSNGQALRAQLPEATDVAAGTMLTMQVGTRSGDQLQARIVAVDGKPVAGDSGFSVSTGTIASSGSLNATVLNAGGNDAQIRNLLTSLGVESGGETLEAAARLLNGQTVATPGQAAFLAANGMASDADMARLMGRLADGTLKLGDTWAGIANAIGAFASGAGTRTLASLAAPLEEGALIAGKAAALAGMLQGTENGAEGLRSADLTLAVTKALETMLRESTAAGISNPSGTAGAIDLSGMLKATLESAAGNAAASVSTAVKDASGAVVSGNAASASAAGATDVDAAESVAATADGVSQAASDPASRLARILLKDPSLRSLFREWGLQPNDPQAGEALVNRLEAALASSADRPAGAAGTAGTAAGTAGSAGAAGSPGAFGTAGGAAGGAAGGLSGSPNGESGFAAFLKGMLDEAGALKAELARADGETLARRITEAVSKPFLSVNAGDSPSVGDLHLPRAVHEMQQRLEWVKEAARQADPDTAAALKPLVAEADSAMRFFNQVTTYNTFVQIPMRMNQQEAQGELYVMQRRGRKGRIDPSDFTLFLSLDTEQLGRVETLAHARNRCVTLNLRVDSEGIADLARDMQNSLREGLAEKKFKLVDLKIRLAEDEPLNLLTAAKQAGRILGIDAGFDMRL